MDQALLHQPLFHPHHRSNVLPQCLQWLVCQRPSCKEEYSEAFVGQHAADSTRFYIFDEASRVPDKIFEVAEGGVTDGEPMIFLFANPTRAEGKFFRVNFGSERERWEHRSVDSHNCRFTALRLSSGTLQNWQDSRTLTTEEPRK